MPIPPCLSRPRWRWIVAPGPDNLYVLACGVAQGRRVALASAWDMCSGLLVHTALAALGLSAVLARSVMAFSVLM